MHFFFFHYNYCSFLSFIDLCAYFCDLCSAFWEGKMVEYDDFTCVCVHSSFCMRYTIINNILISIHKHICREKNMYISMPFNYNAALVLENIQFVYNRLCWQVRKAIPNITVHLDIWNFDFIEATFYNEFVGRNGFLLQRQNIVYRVR